MLYVAPETRPTWTSTGDFPRASVRGLNTRLFTCPHHNGIGIAISSSYTCKVGYMRKAVLRL
ncbi:hypothetical protein GCM10020220_095390 [Nonomuraea rubra]